jgi:hypothetical protein
LHLSPCTKIVKDYSQKHSENIDIFSFFASDFFRSCFLILKENAGKYEFSTLRLQNEFTKVT